MGRGNYSSNDMNAIFFYIPYPSIEDYRKSYKEEGYEYDDCTLYEIMKEDMQENIREFSRVFAKRYKSYYFTTEVMKNIFLDPIMQNDLAEVVITDDDNYVVFEIRTREYLEENKISLSANHIGKIEDNVYKMAANYFGEILLRTSAWTCSTLKRECINEHKEIVEIKKRG